MLCALERLFMVSNLSFVFSVVGFYSPTLKLFIFFSCIPWCMCAELLFWSFGFFYSEFCGSSLSWAPCMYLFSLWGAFYLLTGGCASGALDMRLFVLWWFFFPMIIPSLTRFFGFLLWCLIAILCVLGIALSHILSFYFFSDICLF